MRFGLKLIMVDVLVSERDYFNNPEKGRFRELSKKGYFQHNNGERIS